MTWLLFPVAYDELLSHQLSLIIARSFSRKITKKRKTISQKLSNVIKQKLPFSLTISQEKCIAEIKSDLLTNERMYRLIQGDVGSGKTLEIALALLPKNSKAGPTIGSALAELEM